MNIFKKFAELRKRNKIDKSTVLVNGLLITCIILSISSGIVDIVCYSGLSKSYFHLGTLPIAAAILYTIISIGLTSGKFWCAMKIGMLKELKNRLKTQKKPWYKNIYKALAPWQIVHKILICISLLTAFSMSVNSIGSGIRTMQQNIDNMTRDATTLIELNNSVNSGVKDNREAKKGNIMSTKTAQDNAKAEVEKYWNLLDGYQTKIRAVRANEELSDEEKSEQITKIKSEAVSSLPIVSNKNVEYISKPEFEKEFAKITKGNEVVDSTSVYEEAVAYDKTQIEDTIRALADKEYKYPNGELIAFQNDDGELVNVQLAISRLQNGISLWQSDTGDVGESSRMFTLIATYIKADEKAGGMGASEIMLLIFIFITGIVQEFLIALCTPSATISRNTLTSVSRYLQWKNEEEKERFLISVYQDYVGDGVINQEDFEAKCKKCVELMERSEKDIINQYSKKSLPNPLQGEVDKLKKELEEERNKEPKVIEKEVPVEVIKEVPVEVPVEVIKEVIKEVPVEKKSRKIVKADFSESVDKATAELDDLIKDID